MKGKIFFSFFIVLKNANKTTTTNYYYRLTHLSLSLTFLVKLLRLNEIIKLNLRFIFMLASIFIIKKKNYSFFFKLYMKQEEKIDELFFYFILLK